MKSRDFERRGVHRSGWWASLFLDFDTADNVAIDTIWQKYTFRQKSGVSGIVCREKIKRNRILWFLAERCISLSENAVEKRGI